MRDYLAATALEVHHHLPCAICGGRFRRGQPASGANGSSTVTFPPELHEKVPFKLLEGVSHLLRMPVQQRPKRSGPEAAVYEELQYPQYPAFNFVLLERVALDFQARTATVCNTCFHDLSLQRKGTARLPRFALASGLYAGPLPDELRDLTLGEQLLISRHSIVHSITKLSMPYHDPTKPDHRSYGMKGHAIFFSQEPEKRLKKLPIPASEFADVFHVVFLGEEEKLTERHLESVRELTVSRQRVHRALLWLKQHNPYYFNIEIDDIALSEYASGDGAVPESLRRNVAHSSEAAEDRAAQADFAGRQDTVDERLGESGTPTCVFDASGVVENDVDALGPAAHTAHRRALSSMAERLAQDLGVEENDFEASEAESCSEGSDSDTDTDADEDSPSAACSKLRKRGQMDKRWRAKCQEKSLAHSLQSSSSVFRLPDCERPRTYHPFSTQPE